MLRRDRRAVVAGEEDERRVAETIFVESPHQAAEGVVHLRDVAVMGRVSRVIMWIESRVFVIGSDRLVRLVEADIKKERLSLITAAAEPANRLIGDDMGRVAFHLAHLAAVAN